MPEFEAELQKIDRLAEEGIQVETADWEPIGIILYGEKCTAHRGWEL